MNRKNIIDWNLSAGILHNIIIFHPIGKWNETQGFMDETTFEKRGGDLYLIMQDNV